MHDFAPNGSVKLWVQPWSHRRRQKRVIRDNVAWGGGGGGPPPPPPPHNSRSGGPGGEEGEGERRQITGVEAIKMTKRLSPTPKTPRGRRISCGRLIRCHIGETRIRCVYIKNHPVETRKIIGTR